MEAGGQGRWARRWGEAWDITRARGLLRTSGFTLSVGRLCRVLSREITQSDCRFEGCPPAAVETSEERPGWKRAWWGGEVAAV